MRSIPRLSRKKLFFVTGFLLLIAGVFALVLVIFATVKDKIYPNISVAGVNLGGLTQIEASAGLSSNISVPQKIKLTLQGQSYDVDTKDIDLKYDYQASVERAYAFTRTGNFIYDLYGEIGLAIAPKDFGLALILDTEKLDKITSVISGQVSVDPVYPSITFVNKEIKVDKGKPGIEVDSALLTATIEEALANATTGEIEIPVSIIDPSLTESEVSVARERAGKYLGKSLDVKFEFKDYFYKDSDILKFLNPKGGFEEQKIEDLIEKVSTDVERDPQNPKFTFDSGRVTEFQPALEGIKVDKSALRQKLADSFTTLENGDDKNLSFEIPVQKTPPEVTTDKVNNLGIRELIGRGTSTFFHSIPSRVHNVILAASRMNGTLVKPGDTFSFNDTLGDVSQFTGYQQAYIISGGKTILGDGGGVCQVSTTLFRASLNAGLPIIERAAHAYRVGYYEQNSPPGIDATVYGPSPDLKFKNDTPGYILIEAVVDPKHYSLIFELYGTSDGRVSAISKPVVTNVVPAPEDLYQDDPTLPAGTIKQIDFKAAGAHVSFNYVVSRAGENIYSKTFVSNYRPWQAIYLRGTGPVQ